MKVSMVVKEIALLQVLCMHSAMVVFVLILVVVQVSLTLSVVGIVYSFLGFGFFFLSHTLARVGAVCRDASMAPHGSSIEDGTLLHEREEDGAPIWFYDVKPTVASTTSMLVTEGQKWYAVRKDWEVRIFDSWETCKSHVHGYRGSDFKISGI